MPAQRLLEYLVIFLLCISFWLFVATLPPLRIGIWVDSEFALVAANSLFALIGLTLCGLWFTKETLLGSQRTVLLSSIALFSLCATSYAKNPTLHHFGVPLLGEGSVLFCGLSLLSLAYDNIIINHAIRWSALTAGVVAGSLVFLHHPDHGLGLNPDWLPYVFGAFLAPIALGIYTAGTAACSKKTDTIASVCVSILLLYLSHNKTAIVAVVLCVILWLAIYRLKMSNHLSKSICLSVPLLSILGTYSLANWPSFTTLESRKLAIQSYIFAWQDAPLSLIGGNGWGYYFENLQKHITELPVKFFDGHTWQPTWDGIERLDFHCMHFGAEILFSLGLVGLAMYLALILIPLSKSNVKTFHKLLFAILLAALTSTWFTLICVWPFLILGFAALNNKTFAVKKSYPVALWIGMASVCCGHGALTYWNTAILYPANPQSWLAKFTNTDTLPSTTHLKTNYNYHGLHLGHFLLNLIKESRGVALQVSEAEFRLIFSVYDAATSPLVLDVAMLHALQYFADHKQPQFDLWENAAKAILQKSRKRTDLLVPYGKELIDHQQFSQAKNLIKQIKQINPNDPFAMWLEGLYCLQQRNLASGKKLGKKLMQHALNQDIEKWLLIPEQLKEQLNDKLKNRP